MTPPAQAQAPTASIDRMAALKGRIERAREGLHADRIPRRPQAAQPCPLSFAQQRLWFLDQLLPGNPFYNIPSALPMKAPVNLLALRRSLMAIVQRHDALRTVFTASGDGPRQTVGPAYDPLAREVLDLALWPMPTRQEELDRLATEDARAPFDLARGPMLRARLVHMGSGDHVLLVTMHHIVSDGWSMGVFFRELSTLYEGFARGSAPALPELPIQYPDYAVWQRQQLSPQRVASLLDYWRRQLADLPTLALVPDKPRPAMATFRGAWHEVAIDLKLTEAIEAIARRHDATLFQVMLAAFKAVLSRYAGQTDLVVGAPIANRTRPEVEGLIGFFVNSLVLRTRLDGDPDFAGIVARVRQTTIDAYEHQDLPFERLVEELQPARDMSRNPLVQVTFQIQNAPGATRERPRGIERAARIERATAIFDMAFSLWESSEGMVGGIEYATDVFEAATVRQLADSLQEILRAVAHDDRIRLSEMPLVSPGRQPTLNRLLQGRTSAPPWNDPIAGVLTVAARDPDAPVIVDARGTLDRGDLIDLMLRLANALRGHGVAPGDRVALALPRSREALALMLATHALGAAWVPLDPALPPARLRRVLDVAQPTLVLRESEPLLQSVMAQAAKAPASCGLPEMPGDAAAYVIFTSGSTGTPKGVVVSRAALANHMAWMQDTLPMDQDARVIQRTPLHFDAAVWEWWMPLLGNGVLVLPEAFEAADTGSLVAALCKWDVHVLQTVPSLLRVLLDDPDLHRCQSLRRLCIGGEAVTPDLLDKVRSRWPDIDIVNLYGPTEATIDATWWQAPAGRPGTEPIPVGRPVYNTWVSIRDEQGNPLPEGIVGEICIGGMGLATGYLGADAQAQARFMSDADGTRFYRTGDLGWARHDGLLCCAGRADQQVKVRGNRIELGDVEAALTDHPAVQGAVALTVPGDDGLNELMAFVTVDEGFGALDGTSHEAMAVDHVDDWRSLYESVYDNSRPPAVDALFDTTGWDSSYDGQPIAADAMRDWLDHTLARIAALRPRRVLEVGAGAGLILLSIAPRCQRYVACDFSRPAVARIERTLAARPITGVRVLQAAAHELHLIGESGFDTVILNSVAQYFPSLDYLVSMLAHTQRLMGPGGRLFIGDVRDFNLLEAFHVDVQTTRSRPDDTVEDLQERVRAAIAQDKELLIAPAFFWRIADCLPGPWRAAVRLKRGKVRSEMLDFRYDAVIEAGPPPAPPVLAWHDWRRGGWTSATLIRHLLGTQDAVFGLAGVPDGRPSRALARQGALQAAREQSVAEWLAALPVPDDTLDPESLALAVEHAGWHIEMIPSPQQAGHFDAVLHRGQLTPFQADAAVMARHAPTRARVSTNPLLAKIGPLLERMLKAHLAQQLPSAMVPARVEPVAQIPLLANGKANRQALAMLAARRRAAPTSMEAPANALETLLAGQWADVLRLKRVGVLDHFFNELGGHSLMATQVISRLRQALEIDVPLRLLFEHPTVRGLSAGLVALHGEALASMARILLEVQALGDEELDAMLSTGGDHHG